LQTIKTKVPYAQGVARKREWSTSRIDLCDGRGLFLTGPTAAAAGPICAFLCKLHNFLTKIPLKFVQIIFPFSIDKFIFL